MKYIHIHHLISMMNLKSKTIKSIPKKGRSMVMETLFFCKVLKNNIDEDDYLFYQMLLRFLLEVLNHWFDQWKTK